MATMYDIWKTVNRKYFKALARFTKSGEQEKDFYDYCGGSIDVFYLRECLQVKPDLIQFVEGGMLEDDEFDSIKRATVNPPVQQLTPNKKLKCELVESVKTLAAKLKPSTRHSLIKY
ncbi:hypothetical protein PHMEG_00024515 [Phytophthora megakarya]|uniref:Uncharacterized protein n=1 Tax=Phytophthora megakarya TaxID=4795 RepID=A0A225VEB5_9STRA|nr:hypothetical protein PHMEG_00024515 [Phytophthora megakarya]